MPPPPSDRGRPVPQSRLGRLARFGSVAAGVGTNVIINGAGRLARRERVSLSDLLLTPKNVSRLTDELARLRGAAMKLGQLVSMDGGGVLSDELATIMARLRSDAEPMPEHQLRAVLAANWGAGWEERLAHFGFQPVAAASIGQVHRATTHDGRALAIKVQYPGVRESIGSDVDNVALLLRLSGLVPPAIDVAPLLAEAKRQLREEADYRREAHYVQEFGRLLADERDFLVPEPVPEFSNENVLAMSFAEGHPIEALESAPQDVRDRVIARLAGLALRELFDFRLMQTDPNFANYRFQPETGRIVLLDFGATRAFAPELAARFRTLAQAGLEGDRDAVREAMFALKILEPGHPRIFQAVVLLMFETAFKALTEREVFDFGASDLLETLRGQAETLEDHRDALRAPPVDVLFLQRKLGGLFLLATRLRARVAVGELLRAAVRGDPA